MPEIILKPTLDREEFVAFATFNLPAWASQEQVNRAARQMARQWFDDMYKKHGWVPFQYHGESEFYLIDKGFAPMESGPEMTVDNNKGMVSGPYIPDFNEKKWRLVARFHGVPSRIEHTVDPDLLPTAYFDEEDAGEYATSPELRV